MDKYAKRVEPYIATLTPEEAAVWWSEEAIAERERYALESRE